MKNAFLFMLATFISISSFSQNLPIPTRWKVKKIGISFGVDQDMINNLDYQYMLESSKVRDTDQLNNLPFRQEDYYSGVCENPQFRAIVTLEVPGMRNTELNLAINGIFNRYDGVYYDNYNFQDPFSQEKQEYLSLTSMTSELGLESSMTKRLSLGFINLYGGAGTNLGYSFDGHMHFNGYQHVEEVEQNLNRNFTDVATGKVNGGTSYDDYFDGAAEVKDAFHQRVFVQLGVGIVLFKKLEVGVDYRRGVGYRAVIDGPFRTTQLHSAAATVRWILW